MNWDPNRGTANSSLFGLSCRSVVFYCLLTPLPTLQQGPQREFPGTSHVLSQAFPWPGVRFPASPPCECLGPVSPKPEVREGLCAPIATHCTPALYWMSVHPLSLPLSEGRAWTSQFCFFGVSQRHTVGTQQRAFLQEGWRSWLFPAPPCGTFEAWLFGEMWG